MSVLLTGATGFVGRGLIPPLNHQGFSVTAAARQHSDTLPRLIRQIPVGDLLPDTDWSNALRGMDTVIHLAARVHIMQDTATQPLSAFRHTNTFGTLNLARQAAQAGVRRFIFLSSIKVNGESTRHGTCFSAEDLYVPTDPYGLSKYEAEQGLREIATQTGMEVVIIRPPLVYGPNVKANFLHMMHWLYKGIPLPLGAISNQRSLVALDNLTDLIIMVIKHPAAANQTFLVSDGQDLSTTALLHRMGLALGKPARLLPFPQSLLITGLNLLGKQQIAQRLCGSLQVDITKTCTLLDWKPPQRVDAALKQTANYYLTHLPSKHRTPPTI